MQPPAVTRYRRPFLAPLWLAWLLFIAAVVVAFIAYRSATTTTVVLVRHAEKELSTIDNPPLTVAGEQRAERLAQMFGDVRGAGAIGAIYVSDQRRTQQTAMPLASRLGLQPTVVPSSAISELVSQILREHRGGRTLVVWHSNSMPEIIQKLSGVTVPPIPENEYDDIYIVTVPTFGESNVLRLKY